MEILVYLAITGGLAYLLGKSADLVEAAFVQFAHILRVSPFVVGFIAVSVASSLPEISIAISASANNVPALSVGHLLGASFILVTLVLGLNAFVHKRVPFKGSFGIPQIMLTALVLALQVVVIYDRKLTFAEGLMLIVIYLAYAIYISAKANQHYLSKHKLKNISLQKGDLARKVVRSLLGLVGLVVFSILIVDSASTLAKLVGISDVAVGLLVLAVGTNLPELVIMLRSKPDPDSERLVVGNLMGSAALNTGTIGLVAVLVPHTIVNFAALVPVATLLIVALALFAYLAHTGREITSREGALLIGLYLAFLIVETLPLLS